MSSGKELVEIPLAEIPPGVLDGIREKLWTFSAAVFAVDGERPAHRGTATCVAAGGANYLLTAAHVWKSLRGKRFALSLDADRLLIPVWRDFVQPQILPGVGPEEWGPDLALIRIPDIVASDLRRVKAFYNLDRRRSEYAEPARYDRGLWAVIGAPAEWSAFGPHDAVLQLSLFGSWIVKACEREGLDYLDLAFDHEGRPDLPQSYGGISGSGLWQVAVTRSANTGVISWTDAVRLEGVAFFQEFTAKRRGVIRCHGRKSIFQALEGVAEQGLATDERVQPREPPARS